MSFELTTQIDTEGKETEIIEERKTHETVRIFSKEQIQNEVIDLTEQIVALEARITVLTEQLARFKK